MKSISEFKSNAGKLGGFQKPNLFEVVIDFPNNATNGNAGKIQNQMVYMAKAMNLPSSTLSTVEYFYQGKTFKVPGDRQYEPWTCTFFVDKSFLVYNGIADWMQMNRPHESGFGRPGDEYVFTKHIHLKLLDDEGNTSMTYRLHDAYPSSIQNLEFDFGANDAISEMTVQWEYQFWELVKRTDS